MYLVACTDNASGDAVMPKVTAKAPRDWFILAAWLDEDWKDWDRTQQPFHKGMYEAYSTMADLMRDSPPDEREGCLYELLTRVLTSHSEMEDVAA